MRGRSPTRRPRCAGRRESAHAAASKPVDLNDPIWHPIDGITLDKYAQLTAATGPPGASAPATRPRPGSRPTASSPAPGRVVQTGWVNRMATSEAVRTRYGILYSQS